MPLFLVFIITTLIEIYLLISVGSVIGSLSTILLIIVTAFIGSFLLKQQGYATLHNAQLSASKGISPTFEIFEGVIIVISGVLLLTPGFVTDVLGLLGLLPFTRKALILYLIRKNISLTGFKGVTPSSTSYSHKKNNADDITEVEYWKD